MEGQKSFVPSIKRLMDAPPDEIIQTINELFSDVNKMELLDLVSAYETTNMIIAMRGETFSTEERIFFNYLLNNVMRPRITFFARKGGSAVGRMLERVVGETAIY